MPSEDGWMDPAPKTAHSSALEPNTDSSPKEICISRRPDSSPVMCSGPRASEPIESSWAPAMEFVVANIFHHSPFGDVVNSLRSLSLSEDLWSNYLRPVWDMEEEENRNPPTTHFIATVDDLTDVLDFDSEDIDGMDEMLRRTGTTAYGALDRHLII